MKNTIYDAVSESLEKGWKMSKLIKESENEDGLFYHRYSPAVYDSVAVYNREELIERIKNGYTIDTTLGTLAINILFGVDDRP